MHCVRVSLPHYLAKKWLADPDTFRLVVLGRMQAPVADRMDETECVLPAKLRSKARRALSGAVSGASSDLAGGSSDDNETPRPPPPAVALFEQVCSRSSHLRQTVSAWGAEAHIQCLRFEQAVKQAV